MLRSGYSNDFEIKKGLSAPIVVRFCRWFVNINRCFLKPEYHRMDFLRQPCVKRVFVWMGDKLAQKDIRQRSAESLATRYDVGKKKKKFYKFFWGKSPKS